MMTMNKEDEEDIDKSDVFIRDSESGEEAIMKEEGDYDFGEESGDSEAGLFKEDPR